MPQWEIDPTTGDYTQELGDAVLTDSLTIPAFFRLKIRRTQWLYAPNDEYGSDFYLLKKRFNGGDVGNIADVAERALQPMLDDKRAKSIDVVVDETQLALRSNSSMEIDILDAQGQVETLNLPSIRGG